MSWVPVPAFEMLKVAKRRAWKNGFAVGFSAGFFCVLITLHFAGLL